MLNILVHARILKKKIHDTYKNFEKIKENKGFHHQLTKLNCIKSNIIKKDKCSCKSMNLRS